MPGGDNETMVSATDTMVLYSAPAPLARLGPAARAQSRSRGPDGSSWFQPPPFPQRRGGNRRRWPVRPHRLHQGGRLDDRSNEGSALRSPAPDDRRVDL